MRLGLLTAALFTVTAACRDERPHAARNVGALRAGAPSIDLRPTSAPRAERAPSACPWSWRDDTALTLDAPSDVAFDYQVACSATQLSIVWRSGSSAAITSRALREESTWAAPSALGDDIATLGRPYAGSTAVWVAWTTPTGALRSARVDGAVMRSADAQPALHGRFRDPFVLYARGDHALVVSTHRQRLADVSVAHRVGVGSAPPSGARLGDGAVVAASMGAHPRVVTLVNGGGAPRGPWLLRGWSVDATVAMTLAAPSTEGEFGVLPEGGAVSSALLPVGIGRFEFTRTMGERSGALLFQTVMGAERGVPRVAWFDGETPSAMVLPAAVTSLGATFDAPPGDGGTRRAEIVWWGDQNSLEHALVTPSGIERVTRVGERLPSEFAVYEAARSMRWVTCGRERWRVEAKREGGSVRVSAAREACDR